MSLKERLYDYDPELPKSWRPTPGSMLVGTVRRYDHAETAYGPRWICVLEDESGESVAVWLSHTVLLGEFKEKRPKPGERIGIRRLDDAAKGYARYVVLVEGREPEAEVPDFDEFCELGDVAPEDRAEVLAGNGDGASLELPF